MRGDFEKTEVKNIAIFYNQPCNPVLKHCVSCLSPVNRQTPVSNTTLESSRPLCLTFRPFFKLSVTSIFLSISLWRDNAVFLKLKYFWENSNENKSIKEKIAYKQNLLILLLHDYTHTKIKQKKISTFTFKAYPAKDLHNENEINNNN